MSSRTFPTRESLWLGSVFGGIATAVMSAKSDLFSHFCQWIENDYVLDGMDGREGVVVFEHGWQARNGCLVGFFFDPNSDLSPYRSDSYDTSRFLRGMPARQHELAAPAFKGYVVNRHEGDGVPELTAAFWNVDDHLTASAPWIDVIRNGVSLIEKELSGYGDDAISQWQCFYEMSPTQVSLAVHLFQQRISHGAADIQLTDDVIRQLHQESTDERSFRACQDSLAAMRIILPSK